MKTIAHVLALSLALACSSSGESPNSQDAAVVEESAILTVIGADGEPRTRVNWFHNSAQGELLDTGATDDLGRLLFELEAGDTVSTHNGSSVLTIAGLDPETQHTLRFGESDTYMGHVQGSAANSARQYHLFSACNSIGRNVALLYVGRACLSAGRYDLLGYAYDDNDRAMEYAALFDQTSLSTAAPTEVSLSAWAGDFEELSLEPPTSMAGANVVISELAQLRNSLLWTPPQQATVARGLPADVGSVQSYRFEAEIDSVTHTIASPKSASASLELLGGARNLDVRQGSFGPEVEFTAAIEGDYVRAQVVFEGGMSWTVFAPPTTSLVAAPELPSELRPFPALEFGPVHPIGVLRTIDSEDVVGFAEGLSSGRMTGTIESMRYLASGGTERSTETWLAGR